MKEGSLDRLIYRILMSLVTVLSVAIVVVLTIYLTEKPPVIFANAPFPVDNEYYDGGDSIRLSMHVCSDGVKEYRITQLIRNLDTDEIVFLPDIKVVSEDGCHIARGTAKTLPDDSPGGTYRFEFNAIVSGIIRKHIVPFQSEPFKVRK